MRMIQRAKRIAAMLLVCIMCGIVCIPASAEEAASPVDLMPCIGRPLEELAKALGGCSGTVFAQHKNVWSDTVYAHVTVERGTITGWPEDHTFMVFLMRDDYCLDGYRVGDSFGDARACALSEGWMLVSEENGDYEIECVFEKAVGEAVYTLEIQSDYAKKAIEYITMSAVNAAQMEKAMEEAAAYEAENQRAFGGYEEGFVFRNGVTWESTPEEIILSEREEYSHLYEGEGSREIIYSYASDIWYRPSLSYWFIMSDRVNMIEYRFSFGGEPEEHRQDALTKLNGQLGEPAELDQERFVRFDNMMKSGNAELYCNWNLEDGTYVALYADDWDLYILYLKDDEVLSVIEGMIEAEE